MLELIVNVGDAHLEEQVTIGAGTIIYNHHGIGINRIIKGRFTNIVSRSNLSAPLGLNANAIIAAGSTIIEEILEIC